MARHINIARREVTIADNGTTSTDLEIDDFKIMTLLIPDNLISTVLNIDVKDGATYYRVTDESGSDIAITLAADPSSDAIGFDASLLEIIGGTVIRFVVDQSETGGPHTLVALLKK